MFFSPITQGGTIRTTDHAVIAAAAAIRQAGTPTARAAAALDRRGDARQPAGDLVAVIRARGAPGGGGSFHPGLARRW